MTKIEQSGDKTMAVAGLKKLYYVKGTTLTLPLLGEAMKTLLLQDLPPQWLDVGTNNHPAMTAISQQLDTFGHRQVHDLQVRSLPIASYGGLLRHFYLRINDIVEVHPGTEQRLSLRGWHSETDIGSDRLEQRTLACEVCTNFWLDRCWQSARAFNLVIKNCDQLFNEAGQSFMVATLIALMASAISAILFWPGFRLVALSMLIGLLLLLRLHYVVSTHNDGLGMLGFVEPISGQALLIERCPHLSDQSSEQAAGG